MDKGYKIVLVIGNGFDLDMGLKTRYSDFIESDFFKSYVTGIDELYRFKNYDLGEVKDLSIFNYLKGLSQLNNWIDIESALDDLASNSMKSRRSDGTVDINQRIASKKEETTFQELHEALCNYLKSINYSKIRRDSVALSLLKVLYVYGNYEILSFNYTNLKYLESEVGPVDNIPIDYIHGQVSDNSIILGIQDGSTIDESYCFMIKTFSPHFKSHNVRRKLLDANEIIFFGHSLGSMDYHYFEDLFKRQSRANGEEKADENLILRIFTYDESSRREVLTQLRKMNEKRTDMLYDLCDFQIYRTGSMIDQEKIKDYLSELTDRIKSYGLNQFIKEIVDIEK